MADQREAILSRLVAVCGAVTGINVAVRNQLDDPELGRPAVIVLDGVERVVTAQPTTAYGTTVSQIMRVALTPQIIVAIRGNGGGEGGSLLTLYRNSLLAAILNDATLLASVEANGGIVYEGCDVPEPDPEGREFRLRLNIVFTYIFRLSDL